MKTVVLTSNKNLEIQRQTLPPIPEGEILVQVKACGICSSDIYRSHEEGAYFYPLIMGHEFAGIVKELGPNLTRDFKIGDRVAIFPLLPCNQCAYCEKKEYVRCKNYGYYGSRAHGGLSEYIHIKEWNLLKLPPSISFENGAALEPMAVSYHALKRLGPSPSTQGPLLILGAGLLGLILLKIIKMKYPQLKVHFLDRNQFKLDLAKKNGANSTSLVKTKNNWSEFLESNHNNYSLIIEGTGDPVSFRNSIKLAAPGAKLIWMGNISGDLNLKASEVSQILRKELTLRGTWNSDYDGEHSSDWTQVLELLQNGLTIEDLLTEKVTLDEVPFYLKSLHAKKMGSGERDLLKVMVLNP